MKAWSEQLDPAGETGVRVPSDMGWMKRCVLTGVHTDPIHC